MDKTAELCRKMGISAHRQSYSHGGNAERHEEHEEHEMHKKRKAKHMNEGGEAMAPIGRTKLGKPLMGARQMSPDIVSKLKGAVPISKAGLRGAQAMRKGGRSKCK